MKGGSSSTIMEEEKKSGKKGKEGYHIFHHLGGMGKNVLGSSFLVRGNRKGKAFSSFLLQWNE